ncbi:hypothetical protein HID58_055310 [Brassica napus]|uniref:Uncharacterized protein n=1 Tax=Brassica napus TaxID=3708 RepID=A0ABQ8AL99_BRANA|nr:hypothetical protein HID58_055310 [Brassica napus]
MKMRISNFSPMFSDLRAGRSSTTVEILPAGILGVEISPSPVVLAPPSRFRLLGFWESRSLPLVVRDVSIPPGKKKGSAIALHRASDSPRLNRQRLEIYVGASRGLYYPHTDFAIAINTQQCEVCQHFLLPKTGPDLDQSYPSRHVNMLSEMDLDLREPIDSFCNSTHSEFD